MARTSHNPDNRTMTATDLYALLNERYATCSQAERYLEAATWDLIHQTVHVLGITATRERVQRWQTDARHEVVRQVLDEFLQLSPQE
jgi:hypothetical protein